AALGSTPDGVGRRHVLVRIAGDLIPPDALAAPVADSVQSVGAVALRVPAVACSAPAGAPEKHAPVAASAVAGRHPAAAGGSLPSAAAAVPLAAFARG